MRTLCGTILAAAVALAAFGDDGNCPVAENKGGRENIEWSMYYAFGMTDETRNLPRVLLVGDSICNFYQTDVRERLKGKANVTFWVSSYCVTRPEYRRRLLLALDDAKYDVIHFNNGLHSLKTPTDAWANALKATLELVREKQPQAKIVWCSSTPLTDADKTAKCRELNAAATKVVAEFGVDGTDDLFALCDPLDRKENWMDPFHFKPAAVAKQADQVAESVLSVLHDGGAAAATATATEVKVDFGTSAGLVKPMHGVGQPPMAGALRDWLMMHYLKEAGVPYSRLHDVGGWLGHGLYVDIPNLFPDFDADENDPANYRFVFTDSLMKALEANGVEPFFRLGVTIENWVGYGGDFPPLRTVPPKDFAKWARICEHVIRHYTEGWANGFKMKITYWEIWNEPENEPKPEINAMWSGTWDEYCRFYETVAKHLKKEFPHLKIGGYGSCGFYAAAPGTWVCPRTVYMVDCYTNFLAHVKKTGAPLDFFSFHAYSNPKDAVLQTKWGIETLRAYGFVNTETTLDEWHPGGNVGTAEQAANVCAEMIGLQKTDLDSAMVYDARCGVGSWSLLFNPLTLKPHKAYYALKAFNELYRLKNAVKTASSDEDVWVLAACCGESVKVLVANTSGEEKRVDWQLQGRAVKSAIVTDESHDYENVVPRPVLSPHSFTLFELDK